MVQDEVIQSVSWVPDQGDLIEDRYKLRDVIGRGGMGVVYGAIDTKLMRPVALKFLDPDLVGNAEAVGRFQREALTAGRIGHENICDVRDMGTTDEKAPYIVMELLEGQPLSRRLGQTSRIPPAEAVEIVLQVLSALEAAHGAGVLHRDLKPENVFLTTGGSDQLRVKLVDFGISKFLGEPGDLRLTKTGVVMGSPYYMSPEQARGREDIDQRSDLWAVGIILFEMLMGELPFTGANYNEVMIRIVTEKLPSTRDLFPELPRPIEVVLLKALAKNRDKRFRSARDFADALEGAAEACDDELEKLSDIAEISQRQIIESSEKSQGSSKISKLKLVLVVAAVAIVVTFGAFVGLYFVIDDDGERNVTTTETIELGGTTTHRGGGEPTESAPRPQSSKASNGEGTVSPIVAPAKTEGVDRNAEHVSVRLRGLPSGATVIFNDEIVDGAVLVGPRGQAGTLRIDVHGQEPLRLDLTLVDGLEIDVAERLAESQRSTPSRKIRPAKQTPVSSSASETAESPGDRDEGDRGSPLFIKGRAGSKILTTTERADR